MSSKKNKWINDAQKFIQAGKFDKAIKELNKVLEEDPSDVRTRLKVAELHAKKGERAEATAVFRQVAEFYAEQGFFLKAVAVYKQILKLDPMQLEITLKLAELYEHLGLAQEAMVQYQMVAGMHDQSGNSREALAVLARMVELEPENVASRVKLAESYSREGMVPEAVAEFNRAADLLKRQNRIDDYLKVAERLVFHDPNRLDVVKELAHIYLARNDTKRGIAKLQICFKAQPQDIETLTLLAAAFQELGQTPKTVYVYRELAGIYTQNGRLDEARMIWRRVLELEPSDPQACAALGVVPSVPAPMGHAPMVSASDIGSAVPAGPTVTGSFPAILQPPAPPVARPPSAAAPPAPIPPTAKKKPPKQTSKSDQISKLLTETDVYVKYGLREKAIEHLKRALELEPQSVETYAKMKEIYTGAGDSTRAADALAAIVRIHAQRGEAEEQEAARQELAQLSPSHPAAQPGANLDAMDVAVHIEDEVEDIDIDMGTGSFSRRDVEAALAQPQVSDVEDDFRDPSERSPSTEELVAVLEPEVHIEGLDDLDVAPPAAEPPKPKRPAPAPARVAPPARPAPPLRRVAKGPAGKPGSAKPPADEDDEAAAFLASLEVEVPKRVVPPPASMAQDLEEAAEEDVALLSGDLEVETEIPKAAASPHDDEDDDKPDFGAGASSGRTISFDRHGNRAARASEPASPMVDDLLVGPGSEPPDPELEEELDSAAFFLDQGLPDDARNAVLDVLRKRPLYPRAVTMLDRVESEMGLRPQAQAQAQAQANSPPAFDAASDLMDEAGAAPSSGDDELAAERHYEMGKAYLEMDLYEEAMVELTSATGYASKRAESFALLGKCMLKKGDTDAAVGNFVQALESQPSKELGTEMKYEIAAVYELLEDDQVALYWYAQAFEDDPEYRDVHEKILALSPPPDDDPGPGGNGNGSGGRGGHHDSGGGPSGAKKSNKITYL